MMMSSSRKTKPSQRALSQNSVRTGVGTP
jgi:nicotinate-nucleotide pyrophosphorylase